MMAAPSLPASPIEALRATLPEALSQALVSASELHRRSVRRELLPTAVPPLDRLLQGGLPRGTLVEVVAPRSSGRFSLGLAALAAATRAGEAAALVDLGDHLDPQAAAAGGLDLRRLLWVRPRKAKEALAAAETLLSAGFPLVVLDLGLSVPRGVRRPASWVRLSRGALVQNATLLVLSPVRVTGAVGQAVLSAHALRALWSAAGDSFGLPHIPSGASSDTPVLVGISISLTLEKRTGERTGASNGWRLQTRESTVVLPAPPEPLSAPHPPLHSFGLPAPHAFPARRASRA